MVVSHSVFEEKKILGDVFLKRILGASLVAQWLRICLPIQGTRFRALVWEDPTCRRACEPQLLSLRSRAREPQLLSPRATTTEAVCHNY